MVNVAKHALNSKVFSPLFTQAWKLLPGNFLFLLSICLSKAEIWLMFYMYCRQHIPAPVARPAECLLLWTIVHRFDPGPRCTKVLKHGISSSSLVTQTYGVELGLVDSVSGCGIMSSVWCMILQWGSTINVSIELPVSTRQYRNMTENLLKATLNPNKQQQLCCTYQIIS